MTRSVGLAALAGLAGLVAAKDDGLALTPPRGWRSWNALGLKVDQPTMQAVMDAMLVRRPLWNGSLASLADVGFTDVGLDDGWQACHAGVGGGFHRADGTPIVNTTRFPDLAGMTAYAHARGLTAGFYGNNCYCADASDAVANFQGDVAALVAAGFDGYKVDSCGGQKDVALYSSLLTASGRPVVLENCHNGGYRPQVPYKPGGPTWCPFHTYRASTDITVNYGVIMGLNLQTLVPLAAANLSFPGCWAYADMLEVGVPPGLHKDETALTDAEARAHFGAWAVTSNPLVLGLDVRNDSLVTRHWDVIANTEALEVNAAWAGAPGSRVAGAATDVSWAPCGWAASCSAPAWEVWYKPLPGGRGAVLLLNHNATGAAATTVSVPLASLPGLACGATGACAVRDVWHHADLGDVSGAFSADVPPHDSVFVVLSAPAAA